jgi:hypothetical protein
MGSVSFQSRKLSLQIIPLLDNAIKDGPHNALSLKFDGGHF